MLHLSCHNLERDGTAVRSSPSAVRRRMPSLWRWPFSMVAVCLLFLSGGWSAVVGQDGKKPEQEALQSDASNDPLPTGAILRIGSLRLRHRDGCSFLAFNQDGKSLISAGDDQKSRIWEIPSGRLLHEWPFSCPGRGNIAASSEGKWLAHASGEGRIDVWDVGSKKKVRELQGGKGVALCLCFSGDGRTLASGHEDGTIQLWNVTDGAKTGTLRVGSAPIVALAYSPNGEILAAINKPADDEAPQEIRCWNLQNPKASRRINYSSTFATRSSGLFFCLDSETLIVSSNDNTTVLNLSDGKAKQRIDATYSCQSLNGKVVAGVVDNGVTIRDARSLKETCLIPVEQARKKLFLLALSADGKYLAAADQRGWVRLWDVPTKRELDTTAGHTGAVLNVALSQDGATIVTRGEDRSIRVWDRTGKRRQQIHVKVNDWSLALSPDGQTIAALDSREEKDSALNRLRIWDVKSAEEIHQFLVRQEVRNLTFSPDGKLLAGVSSTGLHCWEIKTGKEQILLKQEEKGTCCVVFSPDGTCLATSRVNGNGNPEQERYSVRVWSLATGKQLHTTEETTTFQGVYAVVLDNQTLAMRTVHPLILYDWKRKSTRVILPRDAKTEAVSTVLLSSASRTVLTLQPRETGVRLWDVATGQSLFVLKGHLSDVSSVAMSGNGRIAASASLDGTVLIWDLATLPGAIARQHARRRSAEENWETLEKVDSLQAFRATGEMMIDPHTLSLLKKQLRPTPLKRVEYVQRLIATLQDDAFEVREKAIRELELLGRIAEPELRKALESAPSADLRRQLHQLLERADPYELTTDELRDARIVRVLEAMNTRESRQFLIELSKGEPLAVRTKEAKDALQRLDTVSP